MQFPASGLGVGKTVNKCQQCNNNNTMKLNYQFEVTATYTPGGTPYTFGAMEATPVGTVCLAQTRADSLGVVRVTGCKPYDAKVKHSFELRLIYGSVQDMRKFLDVWASDMSAEDETAMHSKLLEEANPHGQD